MTDDSETTSAPAPTTGDNRSPISGRRRLGTGQARRERPIRERDRIFLNEYVQFGFMHHVIAAEALRSAYEHADGVATRMREHVERTDRASAAEIASRMNDGARVQTVVVARLLSELAAAIEDLAALMHAVRHRDRGGILAEYLEADVSAAACIPLSANIG